MPRHAVAADTPYYVLLDGNHRVGPHVVPLRSGVECAPIYGFSDKGPYDKFCLNSELALTPYPLVKVYLRSQADVPGDGLKLVVLDAVGPHEPQLVAATIETVLAAHKNRTTQVTAAYRLSFDREAHAYTVETDGDRHDDP